MELDELKNEWQSVNNQTAIQKKLTPKMIDKMMHKKYDSAIKKIKYPEWAGGIICLLAVIFIVFNFGKLDTLFFKTVGVAAVLLLLLLPAISVLSFNRFNLTADVSKPYAETLRQFAIEKLRFKKLQQANAFLSYLLLVCVIILLPEFFGGKDITTLKFFWVYAFSIGYLFLLFVSKWVKKVYGNSLNQAEELLKALE